MELIPYYDFEARHGKLNSVLLLGIKRIETDNWGTSMDGSYKSFPRIFIHYLNDQTVKLDFGNEDKDKAELVLNDIRKIVNENMKYIVNNNMLEQVFKISK